MRLKERNSCYKSQSVRFITSLPTSDVFIFLPGKDQNEVGTNIKDYFEHIEIFVSSSKKCRIRESNEVKMDSNR